MRRLGLFLSLAIVLVLPAGAAARFGFTGSPADAADNSRVVIRFVAPYASDAARSYRLSVQPRLQSNGGGGGVRGYERVVRPGGVKRGQRVGVSLTPIGCGWNSGYAGWCPGLYIATVRFGTRHIGSFEFVVRR
jgi:hypothetical protein